MIIIVKAWWIWQVKPDVQLQPWPHPLGQYLNVMIDFKRLWRQYDADYDEHYCNYCKSLIYSCNPGHILWGNASRACKADGTWQGELAMNRIRDNFHFLFWFSPFFATPLFFSLPHKSCNGVGWVATSDGTTKWKVHFDGILLPEPLQQLACCHLWGEKRTTIYPALVFLRPTVPVQMPHIISLLRVFHSKFHLAFSSSYSFTITILFVLKISYFLLNSPHFRGGSFLQPGESSFPIDYLD